MYSFLGSSLWQWGFSLLLQCSTAPVLIGWPLTASSGVVIGYWPSPAHSFLVSSLMGPMTICVLLMTLYQSWFGFVWFREIPAGLHQHSHSWFQVPQDIWPYFTVSQFWESCNHWHSHSLFLCIWLQHELHKKHFSSSSYIVMHISIPTGTVLLSRCLAMDFFPSSTIPAFRHHVTVFLQGIS
jgi:hypothetical protein